MIWGGFHPLFLDFHPFVSLVFQPAEQPGLFKGRFLGFFWNRTSRSVAGTPQETWTWSLWRTDFTKLLANRLQVFSVHVFIFFAKWKLCKITMYKMKNVNLKQSVCPSLSQSTYSPPVYPNLSSPSPYSPSLSHKLAGPIEHPSFQPFVCPSYSLPKEYL